MQKELVNEFVKCIEKLMEQSDETDYVQDTKGRYLKVTYMKNLISEAQELIKYGEIEVALENMLENLNEASIFIDEETANLVRKAYGSEISVGMEKVLDLLVKVS